MLPFARYWGAGYLFFGNEQTAGTTYRDKEGRWTVHPCFDQSHQWTLHIDSMTSLLTIPEPVRTGSLIEPLMDMMIQGILVRRYPKYADLQMSCFVEDEGGRESRWCHNCTICAKMYLMCAGAGVDPAAVGFRRSMLTEKQRDFFCSFRRLISLPVRPDRRGPGRTVIRFSLCRPFRFRRSARQGI